MCSRAEGTGLDVSVDYPARTLNPRRSKGRSAQELEGCSREASRRRGKKKARLLQPGPSKRRAPRRPLRCRMQRDPTEKRAEAENSMGGDRLPAPPNKNRPAERGGAA